MIRASQNPGPSGGRLSARLFRMAFNPALGSFAFPLLFRVCQKKIASCHSSYQSKFSSIVCLMRKQPKLNRRPPLTKPLVVDHHFGSQSGTLGSISWVGSRGSSRELREAPYRSSPTAEDRRGRAIPRWAAPPTLVPEAFSPRPAYARGRDTSV